MSHHTADDANKEAQETSSEASLEAGVPRWLKTLVIGMGVLLFGGMILLFGLVIKKATSPEGKLGGGALCGGYTIPLKGKGQVTKLEEQDRSIVIWLKQDTQINIRHYNACTGDVVKDITIEADQLP